MINILTEYSPWYILLCVAVALGYAALLYTKDVPWNRITNSLLAGLRFVLVFLLCLLLLGFFIRQITNQFEKPAVVIAVDNSQSIPLVTDTARVRNVLSQLDALGSDLVANEYTLDIRSLKDNATYENTSGIRFDQRATNLSGLLKNIEQSYENRNLAGVILLSDGIYNQGSSPTFMPYNMTIHTVGIGDTVPQVDLNLKSVYHNQISYLGNKFPIVGEVQNTGFEGREIAVLLKQNGNVIDRRIMSLRKNNDLQKVEFLVTATQKGMQHYVMEVQPLSGEFTTKNNSKHIYIDVLDAKEKILFVAAAPHPDIKAIRSALERKDNYQFDVFIPGLTPEEMLRRNEKYDVIILHQLPARLGTANALVRDLLAKGTPVWYIVGSATDLGMFNNMVGMVSISARGNQTDRVTPSFNPRFDKFTFEPERRNIIDKYPPAIVPFGNFRLSPTAEVVLYQRVGSLLTEKPLLAVEDKNGVKTAVMLGEGLWQWRIQEYAQNEAQEAFDELVAKLVQYLSTREDKRRFRVYPLTENELESESVQFETEVYNNIYERIYGQKISLTVTDEQGRNTSYTYTNTDASFKYRVSGLPQGVYRYKATTVLNGKTEVSSGEFTIREVQMESLNTTADFNLLRQLASQTNGRFVQASQVNQLRDLLLKNKAASIIHSSEEMKDLINMRWIFFVLLSLAAIEWFVRKFRGSY